MSRDDIDSPDYNDSNLGDCRETPEEKEIARLERKLRAACEERDRHKADSEALDYLIRYVINVHKYAFPLLHPDIPAIKNMPEHLRKLLEGK